MKKHVEQISMGKTIVFSIGNTNNRYGEFSGGKLKRSGIFSESEMSRIAKTSYENIFMASVNKKNEKKFLREFTLAGVTVLEKRKGIITSQYDLTMLGMDRYISIAKCINDKSYPALLIDTGTADTFDFISSTGIHLGGFISPGLTTMAKSLAKFTFALDEVEPDDHNLKIATNTEDACRFGVFTVWLTGILSFCSLFRKTEESGKIIISGGNSYRLKDYVPDAAIIPDYLLCAINEYGKRIQSLQ
ncbi:MAG: type III pantothenate kinase [bacterium]|nr:type III pantothenate kinase [bacterium]